MVKTVDQGLIDQGLTLMLVGMGTVFVFLTALVIAMTSMSAIVRRLEPAANIGIAHRRQPGHLLIEAPRGTLFHEYDLDEDGLVALLESHGIAVP